MKMVDQSAVFWKVSHIAHLLFQSLCTHPSHSEDFISYCYGTTKKITFDVMSTVSFSVHTHCAYALIKCMAHFLYFPSFLYSDFLDVTSNAIKYVKQPNEAHKRTHKIRGAKSFCNYFSKTPTLISDGYITSSVHCVVLYETCLSTQQLDYERLFTTISSKETVTSQSA